MQRGNEDIISQLREAIGMQNTLIEQLTKSVSYWQDQAMMLLDRDVQAAIYGESHRGMVEVRDLGSGDEQTV